MIGETENAEVFVLILVDDLTVVYCVICMLAGTGAHLAWFMGRWVTT